MTPTYPTPHPPTHPPRPATPLSAFAAANATSAARWVLRLADLGEGWQRSVCVCVYVCVRVRVCVCVCARVCVYYTHACKHSSRQAVREPNAAQHSAGHSGP